MIMRMRMMFCLLLFADATIGYKVPGGERYCWYNLTCLPFASGSPRRRPTDILRRQQYLPQRSTHIASVSPFRSSSVSLTSIIMLCGGSMYVRLALMGLFVELVADGADGGVGPRRNWDVVVFCYPVTPK